MYYHKELNILTCSNYFLRKNIENNCIFNILILAK